MDNNNDAYNLRQTLGKDSLILIGWRCQYCQGKCKKISNKKYFGITEEVTGTNFVCKKCDARVSGIKNSGFGMGLVRTLEDQRILLKADKYKDWIIEKSANKNNISIDESFEKWKVWIGNEMNLKPMFVDLYLMDLEQLKEVILLHKKFKK